MIARTIISSLRLALEEAPAVCLLGPRQVGKTTLALELAEGRPSVYLDLESELDLARVRDAAAFLERHTRELVILDEVHRLPGLFPTLRGLIDAGRRGGRRHGMYLLLGSASPDLLRQSAESLAGRIRYLELPPFTAVELADEAMDTLWLRGGFPDSVLAASEGASLRWRLDFIRTYLERDIPQFGPRIAAETLRRFWTMLAHRQGSTLNTAELARGLGVDNKTAARYLDVLVDLFLVRRLPPWHANVGKRLVKSPKVYLRDSGVLHALLHIDSFDALLGHPVLGASWEGFVVENILRCLPEGGTGWFYRSSGGAEIDLLLDLPGGERWAIEIKHSRSPRVDRGFHEACADTLPARKFIVHPVEQRYPLRDGIEVIGVRGLLEELSSRML